MKGLKKTFDKNLTDVLKNNPTRSPIHLLRSIDFIKNLYYRDYNGRLVLLPPTLQEDGMYCILPVDDIAITYFCNRNQNHRSLESVFGHDIQYIDVGLSIVNIRSFMRIHKEISNHDTSLGGLGIFGYLLLFTTRDFEEYIDEINVFAITNLGAVIKNKLAIGDIKNISTSKSIISTYN